MRIFPLYYVSLVLVLGFWLWDRVPLWGWDAPAWFFVFLGNIPTALHDSWPRGRFTNVLWSLQIEEQFYLIYPFVVARCSTSQLKTLLKACVVVAPVLRVLLFLAFPDYWHAAYVLMPCRMDALAIGGLVAIAARERALPTTSRTASMLAVSLAACLALFMWRGPLALDAVTRTVGYTIIDVAAGLLLVLVLTAPAGALASMLRWTPLVYTGQVSFSLYLLHLPAAYLLNNVFALFRPMYYGGTARVLVSLVAAYAAASLSWVTIERWGRHLRARLDSPARTSAS